MLPLRLFRSRAFSATNGVSLIMNFGIFGSIFLLAQFLQTVQGYSAFEAGVRTLPWTLMPMFVAPLAGLYSDRIGSRPLMFTGLALQATALGWLATVASPTVAYSSLVVPFVLAGIGMALVFAPVANTILASVSRSDEGKASGANNAIREVGGTLGVAVLASVFSREGNTLTGQGFVDGLVPAVWIGAVVLAAGALLALAVPGRRARARSRQREGGSDAGSPSRLSISAHREDGGRARGPGHGRDAGAQRELTRTHDGERGHEAPRSVDMRPADAMPPGDRQSASSSSVRPRSSARRPLTRATVGAARPCGTTTRCSGKRRAAMRTSTRPGADASRTVAAPEHATRVVAIPRALARSRSVFTS